MYFFSFFITCDVPVLQATGVFILLKYVADPISVATRRIPSFTTVNVLSEIGRSSIRLMLVSSIERFELLMMAFTRCDSYLVPLFATVAQ